MRLVAMVLAIGLLAGSAPTAAFAKKADELDRKEVIKRARNWTSKKVPYSQSGYKKGYRRDCSGFISMAWDLPVNLITWNIPTVAKRIKKSELKPGDVLLNAKGGQGGRHVVMFEKWANKRKTKAVILEQSGAKDRAVRRVAKYPYEFDKKLYKPYRYVGVKGYYKEFKKRERQMVKGYKGRLAEKDEPSKKQDAEPAQPEQKPAPSPSTSASAETPTGNRADADSAILVDVIKAVYLRGYVGEQPI